MMRQQRQSEKRLTMIAEIGGHVANAQAAMRVGRSCREAGRLASGAGRAGRRITEPRANGGGIGINVVEEGENQVGMDFGIVGVEGKAWRRRRRPRRVGLCPSGHCRDCCRLRQMGLRAMAWR